MVAQLRPEQITYDPRTGRYRSEFGGFVSAKDIRSIVDGEATRLNTRLQTINDALLNGAIPIALWEEAIASQIKQSHLRVTALGAGGDEALRRSPLARRYFGMAGRNLRDVYAGIRGLGDRIENGELTPAQIRDRVRRQANTVIPAHSRAQLLTRIAQQGHNEGIRKLDVRADHCPSCPNYARREWTPIDQIIPVGHACECGGYCKCSIQTRFNPKLAIAQLGETSIADMVQRSEERQALQSEIVRFSRPTAEWTPPQTVEELGRGGFAKVSTTDRGTVLKETIREGAPPLTKEAQMQRRGAELGLSPRVIGFNDKSLEMEDLSATHEQFYDYRQAGKDYTQDGLLRFTEAFESMHRSRMAHGDLHGENIFADKQSGLSNVRFIDYGFAQEIGDDGYLARLRSDLRSYASMVQNHMNSGIAPPPQLQNSTLWNFLTSRPLETYTDLDFNEIQAPRIEYEDAQEYIKSLIGEEVD